jgi:hypothetical protein
VRTLTAIVGLALAASLSLTGLSTASAAQGCDDIAIGSSGTLLAPQVPSSPVFQRHIPTGQYRIIATSSDNGHAAGHQTGQTGEQWYFTTDSGYRSPTTPDLAEGATSQTFDLGVATILESGSVTFHHAQLGSTVDSVDAGIVLECVPPVTTTTTTTVAPPPDTQPPTTPHTHPTSPRPPVTATVPPPEVVPPTVPEPPTTTTHTHPPHTHPPHDHEPVDHDHETVDHRHGDVVVTQTTGGDNCLWVFGGFGAAGLGGLLAWLLRKSSQLKAPNGCGCDDDDDDGAVLLKV